MKSLTRREIGQRLDRLRQTVARYEGAKKKGGAWYNTCVTCGKTLPIAGIQGGHFIGRGFQLYRWDERNVHPQCAGCNLYKNGAYIQYSQWFIKQYGQDIFDQYVDNYKRGQHRTTWTMPELKALHDKWLAEGRALEKKLGQSLFPKSWQPLVEPEFIASPLPE